MTPCFPIYDRRLRPAFGRRDAFERFGCLVRRRLDCLFGDLDRPTQIIEPCLAWRGASRPSGRDHSGPRLRRHGQWLAHEFAGSPLAVMGNAVPMPLMDTIVCCSSPACTGAGGLRGTGDGSVLSLRRSGQCSGAQIILYHCPRCRRYGAVRDGRRCTLSCAKRSRSLRPQIRAGCSAFVGPMGSAGLACPLS